MKIITLNIWGGRHRDFLLEFLKKYSDVDIFLFQEVFNNATSRTNFDGNKDKTEIFKDISNTLEDYNAFYAPCLWNEWGISTFVKKTLMVEENGEVFVHLHKDSMIGRDGTTIGKNLQYLKISSDFQKFTIFNFHGLWNGKGKTDTEDRINQSRKIIDFIKKIEGGIVLCGDFNLRPDTESLKMIEKELNLRNLITENNILTTRSSLYAKPEKFADYIFVSPGFNVKKFEVLKDEVSDHLPLFLEFD